MGEQNLDNFILEYSDFWYLRGHQWKHVVGH